MHGAQHSPAVAVQYRRDQLIPSSHVVTEYKESNWFYLYQITLVKYRGKGHGSAQCTSAPYTGPDLYPVSPLHSSSPRGHSVHSPLLPLLPHPQSLSRTRRVCVQYPQCSYQLLQAVTMAAPRTVAVIIEDLVQK